MATLARTAAFVALAAAMIAVSTHAQEHEHGHGIDEGMGMGASMQHGWDRGETFEDAFARHLDARANRPGAGRGFGSAMPSEEGEVDEGDGIATSPWAFNLGILGNRQREDAAAAKDMAKGPKTCVLYGCIAAVLCIIAQRFVEVCRTSFYFFSF